MTKLEQMAEQLKIAKRKAIELDTAAGKAQKDFTKLTEQAMEAHSKYYQLQNEFMNFIHAGEQH